MSNNVTYNSYSLGRLVYLLIGIATAIIGYHINDSVFWAIIDWMFWPFVWVKWLICQDVNITIIKESFAFFLQ